MRFDTGFLTQAEVARRAAQGGTEYYNPAVFPPKNHNSPLAQRRAEIVSKYPELYPAEIDFILAPLGESTDCPF